ncbi:DNA mismatch repair protein Msh2-like [Limulus polyphemus]|uniref:DNA mismatch repair protein Msh2 n=1 Tax=Limulus polyphemus TaxID=6850 RepID=A0ABM1SP81_LIMPO|nr:DNA mismatch repair protein Msh2-like [Limulus polyphemus]
MSHIENEEGKPEQQQAFISFYLSMPQQPSTTFRFFDRNDFYTLHGSDAVFVAKEFFKSMSVVKYYCSGSRKLETVSLSKLNFESFVRDLLLFHHYRVELYKSQTGSRNNSSWVLDSKASPGNLTEMEGLLFGNMELVEARGVISIKLSTETKLIVVGIAFGDTILRKLIITDFSDNDHFSNLQAVLVHLSPRECLLMKDNSPQQTRLRLVIERSGISITDCKSADFACKDIAQDLQRLLKFKSGETAHSVLPNEVDHKQSAGALASVIKYLELLSDETNFGQYHLLTFDLTQYVRLDGAAVRALGILPSTNDGSKSHSLLGLLNKCRTSPGQRLLGQWIKQPLINIHKIEERLNIVETFVNNTELRQALHEDHLRKIPDLQRLARKLQQKKATLQDCYKIYLFLNHLPAIQNQLESQEGKCMAVFRELYCCPFKDFEEDFVKFREMVETTLDMFMVENGEFFVRPDFDQDLKELYDQMNELEEQIQKTLPKVCIPFNFSISIIITLGETIFDDHVIYDLSHSHVAWSCVPQPHSYREEKALRNRKDFFTIDTKQNGVRFHNSLLRQLNAKYVAIRLDYEKQQKNVVDMIMDIAAGYSEPLLQMSDVIAHLDVLVAFSVLAVSAPVPYVRPQLLPKGSGIISLKQARHPCMELQENVSFIPNDVNFEQGKSIFHIITGPNMSGKSTYIRSVALNILMAQIGCFVPSEEARISVVDAVLARVGAEDRQLKGVSTFMAEMLETSSILKSVTSDSLIIIDELGRGTSTYDGFGLAWSVSEHVATKVGCYCLFATHFHELTALSGEVQGVNNLQVTALTSDDTLTMLYKVIPGVCDQSFGIQVAALAHFPNHVIEFAKKKVKEFEIFSIDSSEMKGKEDMEPHLKKQKILKEADEIMHNFVEAAQKTCSGSNCLSAFEELKNEIQNNNNIVIKKIISGEQD